MQNHSSATSKISRRHFLAVTGTTVALPTIIPLSALGRADNPAPSERITMGVVGCGGMGNGNTDNFLRASDCQVLAACDVDQRHLADMLKKVNKRYGNTDCKGYG